VEGGLAASQVFREAMDPYETPEHQRGMAGAAACVLHGSSCHTRWAPPVNCAHSLLGQDPATCTILTALSHPRSVCLITAAHNQ